MVQIVYIAGADRSGSTMLSRVLDAHPGIVAVGELFDFWHQCIEGDALCGCGVPFLECDFWSAVIDEAFGGFSRMDPARMRALRRSLQGYRHMPFIHFASMRPSGYRQRLREYVNTLDRLYLAIQKVSGCDVIVDSSKIAAYALALNESDMLDVSLVHMIRDSRASAYSWRRKKRDAVTGEEVRYQAQQSLVRSSVAWGLRNSLVAHSARRFAQAVTLRYEDLTIAPRLAIDELLDRLGLERALNWIGDDELVTPTSNHIYWGNPNRVERGTLRIRADDEWRERMPRTHKNLVTALTFPTLWQLGYLGAGDDRRAGHEPAHPGVEVGALASVRSGHPAERQKSP